jgi:tetratricopeptide (TPR) repeat protein
MISLKFVVKFTVIIIFLTVFKGFGQQKVFDGNPDTAFEKARELAFNQQRKQAQDSLLFILTKYPNYHDIRSFLASTYSWDGEYKKARTEFSYILEKDPQRKTDWIAAINNESRRIIKNPAACFGPKSERPKSDRLQKEIDQYIEL